MSTYFLTLRPCVEIMAVTPQQSSILITKGSPSSILIPSSSSNLVETDVIGVISNISLEAMQSIKDWNSRQSCKMSTLLLLLSSSGVIVYLLYKRSLESNSSPKSSLRKKVRKSRWKSRDWLWWIFGEEDDVGNDRRPLVLPRDCFGVDHDHLKTQTCQHLINRRNPIQKTPNLLAPCPNCVRGSCKIRKHQQLTVQDVANSCSTSYTNSPLHLNRNRSSPGILPPTSTPESADDEASDFDFDQQRNIHDSAKLYSVRMQKFHSRFFNYFDPNGTRLQGDGSPDLPSNRHVSTAEKVAAKHKKTSTPSSRNELTVENLQQISRDISMESNLSVSGSMTNLVKEAREIRRLIREASMDSIASEFSLELPSEIHGNSEFHFDSLQTELTELKKNCSAMTDKIETIPLADKVLLSSKSDYGLSSSLPPTDDSFRRAHSPPEGRLVHHKQFWKVHYSDRDSNDGSSLDWDSPLHEWHDWKQTKYKMVLNSQNTSEFGGDDDRSCLSPHDDLDPWEWDSEGLGGTASDLGDYPSPRMRHSKWLPENSVELDMETELASHLGQSGSNFSSRSNSRRGSNDFYLKTRLPPSGRSSVNCGSGDTPRQSIDKAQLIKSFGVYVNKTSPEEAQNVSKQSMESGYQEMESNITGASHLTLSPVHEAKEESQNSTHVTPVRTSNHPKERKPQFRKKIFLDEAKDEILRIEKS